MLMYDDLVAVIMGVYIFATKGSKGWKFEEGTRVKKKTKIYVKNVVLGRKGGIK